MQNGPSWIASGEDVSWSTLVVRCTWCRDWLLDMGASEGQGLFWTYPLPVLG